MAYKYESITNGLFSFTIPGENRTVKLFSGDTVIVEKQLSGTYLKMFKLVEEIKETKKEEPKKTTSKPKAKVADKITSVVETEEVEPKTENVEVKAEDTVKKVEEEKPAPKRRGRKKKSE